jgi:hypothetical protein
MADIIEKSLLLSRTHETVSLDAAGYVVFQIFFYHCFHSLLSDGPKISTFVYLTTIFSLSIYRQLFPFSLSF